MRKVFITGAAGGLGTQISKIHLEAGDEVWAADIAENKQTQAWQNQYAGSYHFLSCNLASTESVRNAIIPQLGNIGELDVLYSCAGVYDFADKVQLRDTNLDRAAWMYEINAVGFLRVVQTLLDAIVDGTHILCVTSEAGSIGANWRSGEYNYCMSKAAENMACAILRQYYKEKNQNTRVICLHPGWLRDKMGGPETLVRLNESVDPAESAKALYQLAIDIDRLPAEDNYLDYQGKKYPW